MTMNRSWERCYSPKNPERSKIQKFYSCDMETQGLGGQLLLIDVYDGQKDKIQHFKTAEEFIDWMLDTKLSIRRFLFHNLDFDYRYLVQALQPRLDDGFTITPVFRSDDRLIAVTITKYENGKAIVWSIEDTLALLPASLERLGKSFGYEKQNIGLKDGAIFDVGNPEHIAYADNDVKILDAIYRRFCALLFDLIQVNPRLTIGSTAIAVHRRFLDRVYLRQRSEIEQYARGGYYGGISFLRTTSRIENLWQIDMNAAYAAGMRFGAPCGTAFFVDHEIPELPGVYDCIVTAAPETVAFTFIPKRTKTGTVYPYGRFQTRLSSVLIAEGRRRGYNIQVISGVCWPRLDYVHNKFVDWCEKLEKVHKGTALGDTIKLLRNSCSGKYGQNNLRRRYTLSKTPPVLSTPVIDSETGLPLFSNLVYEDVIVEQAHMQIGWAIWILDNAKCLLIDAIYKIGPEYVYAGDTDSIIADATAVQRAIDQGLITIDRTQYGAFKIEHKLTWYRPVAPKVGWGETVDGAEVEKHKGLPGKFGLQNLECNIDSLVGYYESVTRALRVLQNPLTALSTVRHRQLSNIRNSAGWVVLADGRVVPITIEDST